MQILSFKVKSFRQLDNPNKGSIQSYEFYVPITSISDHIPNIYKNHTMNKETEKEIEESLLDEQNDIFHLLNKGLVISASKVNYYKDRDIVVVSLTDSELHGNIDGGRTYLSILKLLKNKQNLDKLENKYIKFEVLIGLDHNLVSLIARARNSTMMHFDLSNIQYNII